MASVEAEKINPRLSAVSHVRAEVQLGKLRDPRQRRYARRTQVIDPERRHRNPGAVLEGVEGQDLRNERPQLFCRNFVMQEQQVVPALGHDPRRHGRGPWAMSGSEKDGISADPPGSAFLVFDCSVAWHTDTPRFYSDSAVAMCRVP